MSNGYRNIKLRYVITTPHTIQFTYTHFKQLKAAWKKSSNNSNTRFFRMYEIKTKSIYNNKDEEEEAAEEKETVEQKNSKNSLTFCS